MVKGICFHFRWETKIIAHPQEKSGEKASDSWAKKIYEDNHGAFSYMYDGSEKQMVFATNVKQVGKLVGRCTQMK